MIRIQALLVFALVTTLACERGPLQSADSAELVTGALGNCAVPAAIPDDGFDDLGAIQAALDGQGCAELGTGRYDIFTPSEPKTGRRPIAMLVVSSGERLSGAGPGTTLAFSGSAQLADWYGVEVTGSGAEIEDLTIDSTEVTGASEQTHAVQVTGPATAVSVRSVWFDHAPAPNGGDCIKVVGYPATEVVGLDLEHDEFMHCPRSGVDVHSGLHGLRLTDSGFYGVAKVDITSEDGSDKSGWVIANNVMTEVGIGDAIDLEYVDGVTIANNTMLGRGFFAFDTSHLSFTGNYVAETAGTASGGVVYLERNVTDAVLTGNVILRGPGAPAGPAVELAADNGGWPQRVSLYANQVYQGGASSAIVIATGIDITVAGNDVYLADSDSTAMGISITGVSARSDSIAIANNRIRGVSIAAALRISGSYDGLGAITATGNTARGAATGLRCETPSGIAGPVVSTGNNWPASGCTIATAGL
jgi:hypothetical protein